MEDRIVTVDVEGKAPSLMDEFVIRVPYRLGIVALVTVLGIIWGLQYSTAKLLSLEVVDAIATLFLVHVLLALVFGAVLIWLRRQFRPTPQQIAFFCVVAVFSNILPLGAELFAARHVSAGELAIIISLTPIAVIFFAHLLQSEVLTAKKLTGILIGCSAGVAILVPEAITGGNEGLNWTLVAFVGPLTAGLGNVLMAKHWPTGLDPLQVAVGNLASGTLLLVPLMFYTGLTIDPLAAADISNWAVLGFGFTVGMELYLLALITRLSGAAFASCSDFVAICAGLGWGYLFFTEVPTLWMVAAACLCVAGLKLAADGVLVASSIERELA
jgi:drug/metabolite transporter (DMT)-like permease